MGKDPRCRIQISMQGYQGLLDLTLLTSKAKWRKLNIEGCLGVELEEDLDNALCCGWEEVAHH
jgi:hypothetical protein